MYCQKCGNQIEDNAKFCDACGLPTKTVQTTVQPQLQQTSSQNISTPPTASTNYANTSFKCALWGAALSLCCGIGLLAQPFALLFGVLALKNEEPEKTKAWIGAIIGAIGTVIAVFFAYALIVEAGKE